MSGIAGIYYLDDKPVERETLSRMMDILAHRGPDGADVWCEGSVGLGHRMLWTTPESLLEKLPLANQTGDLVITADARIDNRDELISQLELDIFPKEKITDSQIILAAYEKWGERCPEKLLGDFAFAIWDRREHKLFCARDPIGVKPFYYYHQPGRIFAFASEIKALLVLPEIPRRLNEVKIADFLLQIYNDKTSTFYQDILRCIPADSLTVSQTQLNLNSYWSLDPKRELRLKSNEEYAEAYREIFTKAIRCRLRSAFSIGSMLSGGLDSSSIVCTARQILQQRGGHPLKTFSAIFEDVPESDERFFIQAVLDGGGLEAHFIHGDRLSFLNSLNHMLLLQDQPFDAPNSFINLEIWRLAQQQGVRILLDGLMGDNVVSHGYAYLNELARTGRWLRLTTEIRAMAKRRNCSPWEPIWHYIKNDGIKLRIPPSFLQAWRHLRRYSEPIWKLNPIINSEFAIQTGIVERAKAWAIDQSSIKKTEREQHALELNSGFVPASMEMFNQGSSAFGVEARLPFTDRRLVEFCLSVPPNQKLYRGWSRMIVRRALANCLPPTIQWRDSKGDLGANLIYILTAEGNGLEKLRQDYPETLNSYVNVASLRQLIQKFLDSGTQQNEDQIYTLLLAITISQWLKNELISTTAQE